MEISVIVPTIRDTHRFLQVWGELFGKHEIKYVEVQDGKTPLANGYSPKQLLGKDADVINNFSSECRNLGFVLAKKEYDPDVYITLDDDVEPIGDTIQDHLNTLDMRFPKHWMSTADKYVRGIPYNIRDEMECMVSHGVWEGIKDWDAPTQLVLGNSDVTFYKGHIPKGVFAPICGMNVAFKKGVLPFMYWAPMDKKYNLGRFDDIWMGIELKKNLDKRDWAIATGYAKVLHKRASNVYRNLQNEAKGIEMNDHYGEDEYFKSYNERRLRWEKLFS